MTLIIAEAGVNHDGSLERAISLVDAAADAGADVVKFQMFRADLLATEDAPKAAYQELRTPESTTQAAMLRNLELDRGDFGAIAARCDTRGIEFLCTAFDPESLDFLVRDLSMRRIKIASGDITDARGLVEASRHRLPLIVSTGMATMGEVADALGLIVFARLDSAASPSDAELTAVLVSEAGREEIARSVTLLQCVTAYPAPIDETNLRAMDTLRETFGTAVGLSDHTTTWSVAIAAVARGASVIEKHLTLDRSAAGPDHAASLDPQDFARMVEDIHDVERALGNGEKKPMPSELANIEVARRSLVATAPIASGDVLTPNNIGTRRPATGVSSMQYWSFLGRRATRDYAVNEPIDA